MALFKDLQREVRSCLSRQHWKYINNIITTDNGINKNKLFWHYIKGQRQDKTGISILKLPHCEVTDSIEKAEKMNEHFKSVFTVEDLKDFPLINPSTYATMPDISISVFLGCINYFQI